jgi:hypothetical protein
MAIEYNFRNVRFSLPIDGNGTVHRGSRKLAFSREQIPFSAAEIIDLGGTGSLTWKTTVLVAPANISNFEVQLGQQGTLVWDTLSIQAIMTGCDGESMLFDGELYWVEVEFVEAEADL